MCPFHLDSVNCGGLLRNGHWPHVKEIAHVTFLQGNLLIRSRFHSLLQVSRRKGFSAWFCRATCQRGCSHDVISIDIYVIVLCAPHCRLRTVAASSSSSSFSTQRPTCDPASCTSCLPSLLPVSFLACRNTPILLAKYNLSSKDRRTAEAQFAEAWIEPFETCKGSKES